MGAPLVRSAPFASVELLAAYLQVSIDPGNLMAITALQGATDLMQTEADAVISYVENDTAQLDGSGIDTIVLPERPVVSVAEVLEDYNTDNPISLLGPENGSASQYDFTANGLLIRRPSSLVTRGSFGNVWSDRRQSIQITYSHGYRVDATEVARSQTVAGTTTLTHIAVYGFNAATDTLLTVFDVTADAVVSAAADGYGIKVTGNTTGHQLVVTWEKFVPLLPADLQIMCVAVAARAFAQDGATQESAGSYNASYAGQPGVLTEDERRVLSKYKPARKK